MKRTFTLWILLIILSPGYSGFSQVTTLTLRPGPEDGKGAELSDYYATTNFGTSPWFDANAWTVGGVPINIRSLIWFDLSGIPENASVVSAKLSLFCNPASTHYQLQAGDNQSYLLRVSEPWDDQTATWEFQPSVSMANPVLIPTSTYNTQNYPDIDVTDHVRDMVTHPETNYGWEIRLVTEELFRSMQFSSCYDQEQYRPILTIEYVSCDLPVTDWKYEILDDAVHFTDLSSPSVTSWFWDFGDGYSSSLQNPAHTYDNPGHYQVCLTVFDTCGTTFKCDSVFFCPPINASFSFTSSNYSVSFRDESGPATSWYWDFNDGFYSDLRDPVHVFNAGGHYYVCLTVADSCSAETFCDSVFVTPTAIGDLQDDGMRIWPVPASDRLCISAGSTAPSDYRLILTDMTGKKLMEKEVFLPSPDAKTELDLANFAPGSYVLRMIGDRKSVARRFMIIR